MHARSDVKFTCRFDTAATAAVIVLTTTYSRNESERDELIYRMSTPNITKEEEEEEENIHIDVATTNE